VTLVPLVWLLSVTLTAGAIKVFSPKPGMGFWASAQAMNKALPELQRQLSEAQGKNEQAAITTLQKRIKENRTLWFNNTVDAVVTACFLVLVTVIVLISILEWLWLLRQLKPPVLSETAPVWLPEHAVAEGRPVGWWGFLALLMLTAKELSGESAFDRARQTAQSCPCTSPECQGQVRQNSIGAPNSVRLNASNSGDGLSSGGGLPLGQPQAESEFGAPVLAPPKTSGKIYEEMLEKRYGGGINRCC